MICFITLSFNPDHPKFDRPSFFTFSFHDSLHLRYRPIVGNKMPHKTVESSSFYELYLFLSNDLECARVFKVLRFALVHGRIVGLPLLAGQLLHVVPLSTNLFKRDSFILKNHFPTSAFTKLIFNLQCLTFCFNIPIIYSMPILSYIV